MILKGDCIEVMKAIKPSSVDAIVTDPPYGLEFMGKEWDKLWDKREFGIDEYSKKSYTCSDGSTKKTNPVSRKLSNPNYKAGIEAQLWHTQWLTEAYRVLKPGGSMLVMGGTRTSHRLACAIEDSGFIIKDTLMWIYGSGFPKAQDLGKLIDKRNGDGKHWDGFKVGGIKPAYEPIIWAVKPPEGSYVDNVLKWGVGAVNVDECRVDCKNPADKREAENKNRHADFKSGARENKIYGEDNRTRAEQGNYSISKGRFPANIILSHHPECVQVGVKRTKSKSGGIGKTTAKSHFQRGEVKSGNIYADPDGYETVESWDCHPDCAVRMLDEQSGELKSGERKKGSPYIDKNYVTMGRLSGVHTKDFPANSGGASRFFYCAKASRGERNAGLEELPDKLHGQSGGATQALKEGKSEYLQKDHIGLNKIKIVKNNHPTVKPIKLFEWLIKLITCEGQIILDPFIGSGTTAIATHNADRRCIGIEKEEEYIEIAKRRVLHYQNQPIQQQLALEEGAQIES